MTRAKAGRFRGFLVVSAVLIAAVVAAAGLLVGWFFERQVLTREEARTAEAILSEARQSLEPAAFDAPIDRLHLALFERFRDGVPGYFRLKAFDTSGRIVWSNEPRLVGTAFPDNPDLRRALGGEVRSSVETPRDREHEYEKTTPWVAEVYVPITFGRGPVVGVVEAYRDMTAVVRGIRRTQALVWGVTGLAGVLLWAALAVVAWRASASELRAIRQLAAQNEELVLLHRFTRSLLQPLEPGEVASTVAENAATGLGLARAALYRVPETGDPVVLAAWPRGDGIRVPAAVVRDAAGARTASMRDGLLVVPLVTREATRHVFVGELRDDAGPNVMTREIVLHEAAIVLANAELFADIREAHERLAAIMAGIADRMLIVDRDRRVVWMNAVAREALPDDGGAAGTACFSTLGAGTDACEDCPALRTFRSGQVEHGVRVTHGPGGAPRYLDLVTAPLRDASGQIVQVLEVARDVTELVRMEERLKETNQALLDAQARLVEKERLAAIGQVVVTLHHRILNPLTGILGALRVMRSPDLGAAARAQAVEAAEAEARRIEQVVRQLPDLQQAEGVPYVGKTTMLDLEAGRHGGDPGAPR